MWITVAIKYRNEIAIGLIVLVILAAAAYINYALKDREQLKLDIAALQAELVRIEKQQTLNEDIVNAIRKIKVQSTNYVTVIEGEKPLPPGSVFTVIPSGLFLPSVREANAVGDATSGNAGAVNSTP